VKKKRPILIVVVAVLQVVAVLLMPPKTLASMNPLLLLVPLPVFAFVAWALITLRPVGRTLTIFLQGMNIVVRVLITMAKVVPSKAPGTPADVPLLITSLIAVVLSVVMLFYVDQPEMQLLFES
jgi:hypothetical protein